MEQQFVLAGGYEPAVDPTFWQDRRLGRKFGPGGVWFPVGLRRPVPVWLRLSDGGDDRAASAIVFQLQPDQVGTSAGRGRVSFAVLPVARVRAIRAGFVACDSPVSADRRFALHV